MAYIPPHKRHSKDSEKPSPTPDSLIPHLNRNQNPRSFASNNIHIHRKKYNHQSPQKGYIMYADDSIHRWFSVGLTDDSQFPSATRLHPFPLESNQKEFGDNLVLDLDHPLKSGNDEVRWNLLNSPWVFVAENVQKDLLLAFEKVKNEMEEQKIDQVKPTLVARFGRVLFHGGPSVNRGSVAEATLQKQRRLFYANISISYMDYILTEVMPRIGLNFEEEKEIYHVKLSDNTRPDSTISCKCCVARDSKKLELYKIELSRVRYLVADMSCLGKKMDLRLMLNSKRIIAVISDEEMDAIRSIINSAVLDPDVKGGLRWPLGKESSGDRYIVCGVWHTNAKTFRNSSIGLKARHGDRFDFRTSAGEVTRDVGLKMLGIVSKLLEHRVEVDLISEMLKDNLQLIWESFLCHN